jgi:hypothetical protein
MKRSRLKSDPEKQRAWQERSRRKQIEAQKRGAGLARSKRIKAKRKSKKERDEYMARVYGSRDRLLAIKALPCAVCGALPSENHHLENGGTGRKGSYRSIVNLCVRHHLIYHCECGSPEAFDARFGTNLRALAERLAKEIPA